VNQAIHFPDRENWDESKQAVCFPVLVHGMQLTCAISGRSAAESLWWFKPARGIFAKIAGNLEEEASDLIRDQQEDDQGWVWLS